MSSFVCLSVFLLLGHTLRTRVRALRSLYLPSSVIAGILALAVIQTAKGVGFPMPAGWTAGWSKLPGLLINVVFACLFLGVKLPQVSTLWKNAGPQLAYGQIVAWGQYVVGIGLFLVLLGPVFGLPELFAGVLPVGFEGGHGTAAGMGPVFEELGWSAGRDLAMASATCGMVGAIVVGMVLVNMAARRGYIQRKAKVSTIPEDDTIGIFPIGQRPEAGRLTVSSDAVESFTLHLCVVGVAVLIGLALKGCLLHIEGWVPVLARNHLLSSFPLFPLCMIGGLAVQFWEDKYDRHKLIDLGLTRRIQNCALDFLVVGAIATIRLDVVLAGLVPLLLLVLGGILWNVFCLSVVAKRVLPDAWFERAIAELGQSMGVTATGLLLLRVVDPEYETPAADAFACKQLLHEPFMGGGLWTGMAIPLIAALGALPVFGIALGAVVIWCVVILATGMHRRSQTALGTA